MTDVSIFRRHRELIWAIIISLFLSILPLLSFVESLGVPAILLSSIYIGVLTSTGVFVIIFRKYDAVIGRAKQKDMIGLIAKVFFYPALSAAVGLIYIVLLSTVQIDTTELFSSDTSEILLGFQNFFLFFLTIYSVFGLLEGFWFVYRIMVGEA